MRLTIFAATGGTGRHVLDQAVAAGDDVTVVVRNADAVTADVPVVTADLANADSSMLEPSVVGADAVLSCLARADVAHFMLRVIHEPRTFGQAITISD